MGKSSQTKLSQDAPRVKMHPRVHFGLNINRSETSYRRAQMTNEIPGINLLFFVQRLGMHGLKDTLTGLICQAKDEFALFLMSIYTSY